MYLVTNITVDKTINKGVYLKILLENVYKFVQILNGPIKNKYSS